MTPNTCFVNRISSFIILLYRQCYFLFMQRPVNFDVLSLKVVFYVSFMGFQCYEVRPEFHQTSLFKMDRCATCLFGIRNYGVDINGYVNHPKLGLCIWLQQRSATKQTWPGNKHRKPMQMIMFSSNKHFTINYHVPFYS